MSRVRCSRRKRTSEGGLQVGGQLTPRAGLSYQRPPLSTVPLSRPASQPQHLQLLIVLVSKVEEPGGVEEEVGGVLHQQQDEAQAAQAGGGGGGERRAAQTPSSVGSRAKGPNALGSTLPSPPIPSPP